MKDEQSKKYSLRLINKNEIENDKIMFRSIREAEGLTNGNGITNGNGVENDSSTLRDSYAGEGITNGNGINDNNLLIKNVKRTYRPHNKPIIAGAIIVVLLLILTSFFVLTNRTDKEDIIIDGKFNDWNEDFNYQDSSMDQLENNNINIVEYSVKTSGLFLYLYLKVDGIMLAGSNTSMDMVQIFIDTDENKETGYIFENIGIGADYMIDVSGRYNNIESSRYYEFNNERENNDWNAWESMFMVEGTCHESELEIKIWLDDLEISNNDKIIVYFHTFDANDNHDFSDLLISNEKGALGVYVTNTLDEILEQGKSYDALRLDMKVQASDITINSITLEMIGTVLDSDIESITIKSNGKKISGVFKDGEVTLTPSIIYLPFFSPKKRDVSVFVAVGIATSATSTHTIGMRVKSVNSEPGVVTIKQTTSGLSYIGKETEDIVIDGAFGDWKIQKSYVDKKDDVSNPNVDIVEYNSNIEKETASFYLKVDGGMMAGVRVPAGTRSITTPNIKPKESDETKPKITVGNQEKQPLPVVSGEDTACIFLDTDRTIETGYPVLNNIIGADYMIKIKGQSGNVKSEYYKFNDDKKEWQKTETKPKVATDPKQLEAQIELKDLENINGIDVYFHIIDWKENEDYSDVPVKGKVVSVASSRNVVLEISVTPDTCHTDASQEYDFTIKDTNPINDEKCVKKVKIYAPNGFTITAATAPSGGDGDGGSWSVYMDDVDDYVLFNYSIELGDARTESDDGLSGFKVTATAPSQEGNYTWYVYAADLDDEGEGDEETIGTSVIDAPEFSDIFIPIIGVIGLFVVFKRKKNFIEKGGGQ